MVIPFFLLFPTDDYHTERLISTQRFSVGHLLVTTIPSTSLSQSSFSLARFLHQSEILLKIIQFSLDSYLGA